MRHLQSHGAGTRLPDTCTIRTSSSVRARPASLHLIQWPLWATNASAAPLLCHRTAIKSTQCGPIFLYWNAFVPKAGHKKVSFKDCFSYEFVFSSISLQFDRICVRLPFIPFSIAGVPPSQALPGYLIIAPPSVCVPAVLGVLVVWIQNQKRKRKRKRWHGRGGARRQQRSWKKKMPKILTVNMMFLELFCDVTSSPQRKARLRLSSVVAALVDSPQQSVDSTWGETCLLLLSVCVRRDWFNPYARNLVSISDCIHS